jgi:ferredoxin-NADP reductase
MFKAKQFTLPFLYREQVAKNTYSFYFDRTTTNFDFLPGQYIRMSLPHNDVDDRGTTRFFTIASSPHEQDYLMFIIKIIESSFKRALFHLKKGQDVQFFGPMGRFYLDEADQTERVFLAGGIGMTPFHSMITYAAAKKLQIPITLFVTFSAPEEVVFYEKLTGMTNELVKVIYTVTNPNEKDWKGETGRFSKSLLTKYISAIDRPHYSVVGSPRMVEETKTLLLSMGISEEKIFSEDFSGY